jgi:hypothetical protein
VKSRSVIFSNQNFCLKKLHDKSAFSNAKISDVSDKSDCLCHEIDKFAAMRNNLLNFKPPPPPTYSSNDF